MEKQSFLVLSRLLRIVMAVLAVAGTDAHAQTQGSRFTLEYPMTIPYGETEDFISETSYGGAGLTFLSGFKPNVSWGLSFQWISWAETETSTAYIRNGIPISGNRHRELDAHPLLLMGRYEFNPIANLSPYAGLGIGLAYLDQSEQQGAYYDKDYSNQGIIAPELGVYWNLGGLALGVGTQYLRCFTGGNDTVDLNGLTIRLAIGFST